MEGSVGSKYEIGPMFHKHADSDRSTPPFTPRIVTELLAIGHAHVVRVQALGCRYWQHDNSEDRGLRYQHVAVRHQSFRSLFPFAGTFFCFYPGIKTFLAP